jgi:hypothetical protein
MPMRVSESGGDVRVGALERGGPRPRGRSAMPPWRAAGAARVVIVSCACFRFVSYFAFCVFCGF